MIGLSASGYIIRLLYRPRRGWPSWSRDVPLGATQIELSFSRFWILAIPSNGGLESQHLLVVAYCLNIEALRGGALNAVVESKTSANGLLPAFAVLCSATTRRSNRSRQGWFSYANGPPSFTMCL